MFCDLIVAYKNMYVNKKGLALSCKSYGSPNRVSDNKTSKCGFMRCEVNKARKNETNL